MTSICYHVILNDVILISCDHEIIFGVPNSSVSCENINHLKRFNIVHNICFPCKMNIMNNGECNIVNEFG